MPKAKRCLKYAIPHLRLEGSNALYLWLLSHIERLEVCRSPKAPGIDVFLDLIVKPCATQLSESNLFFLAQCLGTFLDHTSKESRLRIFVNPAGLTLLSATLSHACDIICGKTSMKPSSTEQSAWKFQFDRFFNEHNGTFIYLFSNSSLEVVWQILSSIASLSDQQQKVLLLIEVRDKILEYAVQFKRHPDTKFNVSVNSFLNCLGLNVDLLLAS